MVEQAERARGAERTALLVPIKAFSDAKLRLADVLAPAARAELARRMAAAVLAAGDGLPLAVVCDDEAVRAWSCEQGAEAIWTPELGLNGAVEAGVAHLASRGVSRVIVAHADLPLAVDLRWVGDFGGVTLVPDRHGDGTNVVSVPTKAGFRFSYGPRSFQAHRREAARIGLATRMAPDAALGWDVDVAADLALPDGRRLDEELEQDGAPCR